MKLIDKEALLLALRKKRYSKQSLDLIESQPVVDAIPVKWLENWWKKHSIEYSSGRGYGDGSWYEVEGFYPHIYNLLVEDWEKENETR